MYCRSYFTFVLVVSLTLCLVLAASGAMAQVFDDEPITLPVTPEFAPDEIVVKFRPNVKADKIREVNLRLGALAEQRTYTGAFRVKVPEKMLDKLLKAYKKDPTVEYAEPNYIATGAMIPNDTFYSYQWHMDDDHTRNPGGGSSNPYGGANGGGIRMEEAWEIQTGSSSVIVAVVDSGVAYEDYDPDPPGGEEYFQAPDLASTTFVAGYDFVNDDAHPNDDNRHGTHVTGTIAQSTNNGTGVAGVAFNTAIMPVKVLNADNWGYYSWVADGIEWATDNGADVINLSLSGSSPSTLIENAVAYAYNNGVTVIAAAGNKYLDGNPTQYPAAYDDYVIAVGATRYDENRSYYSNTGSYVDVAAPGGDVTVDQNGDGYGDGVLQNTFPSKNPAGGFGYYFFQGTSMATPHVSAVAALLIADGEAGPDNIRNILESTAEDKGTTGRDDEYGWGIVDAYVALMSVSAVKLSAFTASASDDKAILYWRTEVEIDNVGFAIYRSDTKDGNYIRIAFVPGAQDLETSNDYQLTDDQVQPGQIYYYYLEDVDLSGKRTRSDTVSVNLPGAQAPLPAVTLPIQTELEILPEQNSLLSNYPNPFNPATWIPYNLAETADVTIQIYDVRGRLIRTLDLGYRPAGFYLDKNEAAYWDGRDDTGKRVSSGVYFYSLSAGDFSAIRKMVVLE